MVPSVEQLLQMPQQRLDDLFRASPPGPIPSGEGRGTVIVAPGTELAEVTATVATLLVWQGKVFDPERGILRNRVLPTSTEAIVAQLSTGASWFDGQECIILDYSATSLVARRIRDEMRLLEPGFYLGIVFVGEIKTVNFVLDFRPSDRGGGPWGWLRRLIRSILGRSSASGA